MLWFRNSGTFCQLARKLSKLLQNPDLPELFLQQSRGRGGKLRRAGRRHRLGHRRIHLHVVQVQVPLLLELGAAQAHPRRPVRQVPLQLRGVRAALRQGTDAVPPLPNDAREVEADVHHLRQNVHARARAAAAPQEARPEQVRVRRVQRRLRQRPQVGQPQEDALDDAAVRVQQVRRQFFQHRRGLHPPAGGAPQIQGAVPRYPGVTFPRTLPLDEQHER